MNNLLIKKNDVLAKKKKRGFTLVELVIVIAIIAILAAMAIPKLGSMRTNARVSNDVAAAKNIATIASTMIANGQITTSTTSLTLNAGDDLSKALLAQLDGKANTGVSEASGKPFKVSFGTDGSVTVTVDSKTKTDNQLFPDNDGSGRTTYAGDL